MFGRENLIVHNTIKEENELNLVYYIVWSRPVLSTKYALNLQYSVLFLASCTRRYTGSPAKELYKSVSNVFP